MFAKEPEALIKLAERDVAKMRLAVGRAPRRREPSVEEDSTRKVVDWSGS